jgi:prevent-host-death family protein
MKAVKIAELKDNLSRYIRAAERGSSIVVTDRGRPVARIVPIQTEEGFELIPASRPFAAIRDRIYPPTQTPFDSTTFLLAEREEASIRPGDVKNERRGRAKKAKS